MAFMQPEIYRGEYYEIDTSDGAEIVPADVCGRMTAPVLAGDFQSYVSGVIPDQTGEDPIEPQTGWLARMSAPGYLDCTDWTAHATEADAEAYLQEQYGDDDEQDGDDAQEQN